MLGSISATQRESVEILRILALVVCTMGCLAWDLKARRIPNSWTYPAIVAGLVLFPMEGRWMEALAGIVAGGGVLLGLAMIVPGALGMGDVKLGAAIGALGGWLLVLNAIVYAFILGAVFVLLQAAWSGRAVSIIRQSVALFLGIVQGAVLGRRVPAPEESMATIPFGAFLILGSWVGLLWGGLL